MTIGERVAFFRSLRSLAPEELSAASGVSQTYLSEVESGSRYPTIKSLERICRALNITLAEFFADDLELIYADRMIEMEEHELILNNDQQKLLYELIGTFAK